MGPQLILIEVSLTFDEMDEPYNMSIKLSIALTTFLKLLKMSGAGWFISSFNGNVAKTVCLKHVQGLNDNDLSSWFSLVSCVRDHFWCHCLFKVFGHLTPFFFDPQELWGIAVWAGGSATDVNPFPGHLLSAADLWQLPKCDPFHLTPLPLSNGTLWGREVADRSSAPELRDENHSSPVTQCVSWEALSTSDHCKWNYLLWESSLGTVVCSGAPGGASFGFPGDVVHRSLRAWESWTSVCVFQHLRCTCPGDRACADTIQQCVQKNTWKTGFCFLN